MTVSTAPTPLSYAGNGSTTAFPIVWKYNAKSHVVATLRSSTGTETVWALTTNYTLTAPGDSGTLTAVVAPATGETLVITLEPPNTQSSDIPLGGDLPSATIEDGLDLAAQRDAKIEALFLRALRVPKTDARTGSNLELPIDSERASMFLAFDADGKPIATAGTSANLGPVTPFVDTLLDDTTAGVFIETLHGNLSAETVTADDDEVLIRDTSATTGKRMTFSNFIDRILTVARTFTAAHVHQGAETHSGDETFVTAAFSGAVTSTKACASGFTRISPNFCMATGYSTAVFSVGDSAACTLSDAITGVTDATGVLINTQIIIDAGNGVALRSTGLNYHLSTDTTCATPMNGGHVQDAYEFNSIAAGTQISKGNAVAALKTDANGRFRVKNMSAVGQTVGYVLGYFD